MDASCAVPGLRPRNGGGCAPCELSAGGATFNFSLWKVITVCHLMLEKLESSGMPRVKGQAGCRICDLFCASLSLASWHWSAREIMARSLEEWLMMRCGDTHWHWSKTGLFVARLAEDGVCPRCKEAPENLMHRLWYCRASEQYRSQLNSSVPAAASFPDSSLHTLARAGIRRQAGMCSP